jgi:hypothetical protein
MTPGAKLAAYGAVLVAVLGGGAAVGGAVGPVDTETDPPPAHEEQHAAGGADEADEATEAAPHGEADAEEQAMPGGTLIADQGYRIDADDTTLTAVSSATPSTTPFTFRIVGPDGEPVHRFVAAHERELHLVVVGTDLGTYAHLHPERGTDGTWSVDLPALAPGAYRAFADFAVADGPELTLGVDLVVPGDTAVAPLPAPDRTATVDGYEVTLTGDPAAGSEAEVELTVTRDGEPVTDLSPYLGAFGHLVAIRGGDLAYLHVHPLGDEVHDEHAAGGPAVRFALQVPSAGDYRLFFDFAHGGEVHTAAFTVSVPDGPDGGAS